MDLPVIHDEIDSSSTLADSETDNPKGSRMCDCVGVVCSCACAVHCAAMPFVISWLPALGLSWLADEGFHQWMVGACFLLAVAAVLPGYRRHRRVIVPLLAIGGVSVLATGAFALPDECCQQCVSSDSEIVANAKTGKTSATEKSVAGSGHRACCEETEQGNQCKHDVANHDDPESDSGDHSHGSDKQGDTASLFANAEVAPAETFPGESRKDDSCCTKHEDCLSKVDLVESNGGMTVGAEHELNVVAAGIFPAGTVGSNVSKENGWLDWLSRLLTPLGGALLVSAHLMNRRCCDCCERPA